jgi:hypothetical protein
MQFDKDKTMIVVLNSKKVSGKGAAPPAGQARVFCEQCFELSRLMEQNRQTAEPLVIRHNEYWAASSSK